MANKHGIVATSTGLAGYAQSFSFDQSAKEATAEDANGETVVVEIYDPTVTAKAELVFDDTSVDLEIGDVITISGAKISTHNGAYMLTGIGENQGNKDFAKYSVECKRWTANGIPAAPSV